MDECHAFQTTLLEAQVDKVITPWQSRLSAINLLLIGRKSMSCCAAVRTRK
jgi:hypothetical protein